MTKDHAGGEVGLDSFDLTGRVALITGAGSGMGRACALTFAGAGAEVYALDIDADAAAAVAAAAAAGASGSGSIEGVGVDVTDADAVGAVLKRVDAEHQRLDVLFNHAGRACAPGLELTEQDWLAGSDLNLKTPILLTSQALPLLRKSSSASIIFTASIAGIVASPNSPVYSAVKGGVIMFAKSIAAMLGPEGIRANAICPGTMETPMLVEFFSATPQALAAKRERGEITRDDVVDGVERFAQSVPLGRTGVPEEVAGLALYLASDASRYVTGTAIPVDGGYVAR